MKREEFLISKNSIAKTVSAGKVDDQ